MTGRQPAPARVLVVEPDEAVCRLMTHVMRADGHAVTCRSELTAMTVAILETVDLVVVDGSLIRTPRERDAVSSLGATGVLLVGEADGASPAPVAGGYLPKPFAASALRAAVSSLLRRRRTGSMVD